jgi:hypothetical protein
LRSHTTRPHAPEHTALNRISADLTWLDLTERIESRRRYDLKLWIGSGDGSAAYLPG